MSILDIYKSILAFSGQVVDSEGCVSIEFDDKRRPTLINGKRLVLPTQDQLQTADPEKKIIFHPLSENIMRGESDVIADLRQTINVRLNYTFSIIAQCLLSLIGSPEQHKLLTPDQTELLLAVQDVDKTTVNHFMGLMMAGTKKFPDRLFLNIYLKRGGSLHGKRHARVGIVNFPAYELLLKDQKEIHGVKLRVKDQKAFKQLYEYIFPGIDVKEQYCYASDSNVAPFLDTLMRTASILANPLNELLEKFSDFIPDGSRLVFDSDWLDAFENLNSLSREIHSIPMQSGNEGQSASEEVSTPSQTPLMAPAAYLPPTYPQPGYPPQMAPAALPRPEIKKTRRGIDFQSLKQADPSLVMAPNPLANQLNQQWMMQQMQQQPVMQPGYMPVGYGQAYPQPSYPVAGYPQAAYPQAPYPVAGYPQMAYPQQPMYSTAPFSPQGFSSPV